MRRFILCSAILLLLSPASSQDPPKTGTARYLDASDKQRLHNLQFQKERIADLQERLKRAPRANRNEKRDIIDDLKIAKKELAAMQSSVSIVHPVISSPPKVGEAGVLSSPKAIVFQVRGKDSALVHVVTGQRGLEKKILVVLSGMDMSRHVDGSKIAIDGSLEVVGTEQYGTVIGGTNTVFVLKPFDATEATRIWNEKHRVNDDKKAK